MIGGKGEGDDSTLNVLGGVCWKKIEQFKCDIIIKHIVAPYGSVIRVQLDNRTD